MTVSAPAVHGSAKCSITHVTAPSLTMVHVCVHAGAVPSPDASDEDVDAAGAGAGEDFAAGFNLDPGTRHPPGKGLGGALDNLGRRRPAAAAGEQGMRQSG